MTRLGHERKEQVPWELCELHHRLEGLTGETRQDLLPLCRRVTEWSRRQSRLVRAAQEAVAQLQLDVKYLHFDLDATRAERDALARELRHDRPLP